MGQLRLLGRRRFASLFWAQFLGAFNDNLFKNALVIVIVYRGIEIAGIGPESLAVACAGIFILPFFMFSATAGQLADRHPKSSMICWIKTAEIVIMLLAGIGFAIDSIPMLLGVLFLMGLQSSFFGPAKYSVLPELVEARELVGGNALVETGTFLAILLGTIAGGVFAAQGQDWMRWIGLVVVAVAVAGLLAGLAMPRTRAASPKLTIAYNPITPTIEILRVTARERSVLHSILGISWFWFIGASFLALLPSFCRDVLHGGEPVVTLFLSLFCIGIAGGSLLCERLSDRRLELGLVPLGSLGISLFALDLAITSSMSPAVADGSQLLSVVELIRAPGAIRICIDLMLLAIASGLYTVPLYTLIQQRSAEHERSRVIAGNNVLNALFMVVSAGMLMLFLAAGLTIPVIFGVLAVMNIAVAIFIYAMIPEFPLRFACWVLARVMYRVSVHGREHVPVEGPVILAANHVSFVDWMFISAVAVRPPRFVMDRQFLKLPLVGFLFRDAKVIPIASAREDPQLLEQALDRVAAELGDGEVVCVFPEGRITADGELSPFRLGIERIVARSPVPVVPIALGNVWGSFFSRRHGRAMSRPFRRFWSRVTITIGEPIAPEQLSAQGLAERIAALGGWKVPPAYAGAGDGVAGDLADRRADTADSGQEGAAAPRDPAPATEEPNHRGDPHVEPQSVRQDDQRSAVEK